MVQGDCRSWCYHGKCPRAGECQFIHDSTKRRKVVKSASQAPNKGKGPSKEQDQKGKGKGKGRGKGAGSPKPKIPRGESPSGAADKLPCKYFLRDGKCTKGENCTYWHPPVCRYFQDGTCKKGESCSFLHRKKSPAMPAKSNSPKGEGGPSQEPSAEESHRLHAKARKLLQNQAAVTPQSDWLLQTWLWEQKVLSSQDNKHRFSRTRLHRIGTPTTLLVTTFLQLTDWLTRLRRFHQRKL